LAHAKAQSGDLDGALDIFNELLNGSEPCADTGPPGDACHTMAVRLSWTGDVYAAVDRPNLGEPEKAAALYQRALDIQERIAALDAHDRQARFDLAARYGKLGDAVRRADPRRALALYGRALATAQSLVSKEQVEALKGSYFIAIVRPLTQLGRTAEARHALEEIKKLEEVPQDSKVLADLLGEIDVHELEVPLLSSEARQAEAKHVLQAVISETEQLRAKYPKEFTPVFFLARLYRELASFCTGEERRQAFRQSAAEWHAWPETSFTKREELKDLNAARQ
jgi:tetratricopeptide (TPR) repeat protein